MKKAALVVLLAGFVGIMAFPQSPNDFEEETSQNEKKLPGFFNEDRKPVISGDNTIFGVPQNLDLGISLFTGFDDVFWMSLGFRLDYAAGPFKLTADITFINDQKYAPAAVMLPSGNLGGFYFMLNEGGLSYDKKPVLLQAGRYKNYDEIDSPYSLFLNSSGIPANTLKFRWESNHFIYQTQWIELNWNNGVSSPAWNEYQRRKNKNDFTKPALDNSGKPYEPYDTKGIAYGFPDRGASLKVYGIKVNDWRIGFLDAAVYSGRPIDLEYLVSPIPTYFTQYFKATAGRPWATETNDNTMIGLFWDIKKSEWDVYAQVLVDDFSLGFLKFIYDGFSPNPWKSAWALGGRIQTSIGRFGFHHGGALKYTFEPIDTNDSGRYPRDAAATAYGYAYYPETRYFDGNERVELLIQDSMLGYKYGQNNLAFQVDYQNSFFGFLVTAELELVLAGNNSPANPWHDYEVRASMYEDGKYNSQLFNDGQIEKNLEFRLNVSKRFGQLAAFAAFAIGGRFNRLELSPPDKDVHVPASAGRTIDDEIYIWKASNHHELVFRFSLGCKYSIPIL